jgi:hypothetical protein
VIVNDVEKPVLVCPINIIGNNDPGQCSKVVNYVAPIGTDNCIGATTTLENGLGNGATFPIGISKEEYMTIDSSGNIGMIFEMSININFNELFSI